MLARALPVLIGVFLAVSAACSDPDVGPPRLTPPTAPAANDPAFAISGVTPWNLIGNALTMGHDTLAIAIAAPRGTETVDLWLDSGPGRRLVRTGAEFTITLDIGALLASEHELLFAADGATTAFARVTFFRTHPMYFVVSTDWDFSDPGQAVLLSHDRLRTDHPAIRYTHFIGPYTFTDPAVTEPRKAELATWLTTRRDQFDDEIGLHIHPWCHFVRYAGLTCITDDSTVYQDDPSGYTVKVSAYGQAGFETLLDATAEIFAARGLGAPLTFRAGGWTASIETLAALAAKGFIADTSANNWARMEEWNFPPSELYLWNMATWSMINDTSQPYYPNVADKQSAAAPNVPILEVPDNAIMVDYVSIQEMKDIFAANWPGTALVAPKVFMMGFHPSNNFSPEEYNRVDGILDHGDQFLGSNHAGPVVYAVLRDLPTVWPAP